MGTIREEIHQARPFASVAEEGVVTLVATADRVRSGLSEVVGDGSVAALDGDPHWYTLLGSDEPCRSSGSYACEGGLASA